MTLTALNKKFNSLNKKYVKLDNTYNNNMTDSESFDLSEKLEDIQTEMSKIAGEIERLETV